MVRRFGLIAGVLAALGVGTLGVYVSQVANLGPGIGIGFPGRSRSRGTPPAGGFEYGPPNTPTLTALVLDTNTVVGLLSDFVGSGDDTQASLRIQVDTVTGDFSSPLMDSTQTGTFARDTLSRNAGYNADGTYKMRALYTGDNGGASAWSAPDTFVNSTVAVEPFYSGAYTLILADSFTTYTGITTGSPALDDVYGLRSEGAISLISGMGDVGQAVRFSYNGASDALVEEFFTTTTEVYLQWNYRLSSGADPTTGSPNGSSGYKWLTLSRPDPYFRYTMGVGDLTGGPAGYENTGLEFSSHDNESLSPPMPNPFVQNVSKTPKYGTTNDGDWHRITYYVKTDGASGERIWVDGVLVLDSFEGGPGVPSGGYDHEATGINGFTMPGEIVSSGPTFTQDLDNLIVWKP